MAMDNINKELSMEEKIERLTGKNQKIMKYRFGKKRRPLKDWLD